MTERQSPRNKFLLFIVSVTCFLVSLSCMIAVLSHVPESDGVSSKQKVDLQICVSCDELPQNGTIGDSEQLVINLKTPQTSQCCFENSGQLSSLLELILGNTIEVPEPLPTFDPRNFSVSEAIAHRGIKQSPFASHVKARTFADVNDHLVFKNQKFPGEPEKNVITTDPAKMTITIPGDYLVYSSVEYLATRKPTNRTCQMFVKLGSVTDSETTILQATSPCSGTTAYTAGVFPLQAGDSLHVELSMYGGVAYDRDSTFFGIFMIG